MMSMMSVNNEQQLRGAHMTIHSWVLPGGRYARGGRRRAAEFVQPSHLLELALSVRSIVRCSC